MGMPIYIKKKISYYTKEAEHKAKGTECIICGKKCSSFCNSHIVPKFILKNIDKNGYVYSSAELMDLDYKNKMGISNANTFQVICNECDKKYFACYEDERYLSNGLNNMQMPKAW